MEVDALPRGRVTLMFTDIVDSYRLTERLGQERYLSTLLDPHFKRVRALLSAYRAHEIKTIGDSFMLAFHSALDALNFAVDLQNDLARSPLVCFDGTKQWSLRVRIGFHTSTTELEPEPTGDYFGVEPNLANRIEALADGEQILLSDSARNAIGTNTSYAFAEWSHRRIKGSEKAQTVWECLWDGRSRGEPGSRWHPGWFKGWATPFVSRPAIERTVLDLFTERDLDVFHARVITLCGAGGMGKTRLAISVALQAAGLFRDGVRFVDLSGAQPRVESFEEKVLESVAIAGTPRTSLALLLAQRELLLVLDNYETVASESIARAIREIVTASPDVRILVTGREIIGLDGVEQVVRIDDGMTESESIAMLVSHVRLRRSPSWEPSASDLEALQVVARETEGIPLGLELAAAWSRNRTLEEIARRLLDRSEDLTQQPPRSYGREERHQSLSRCAASSIALLSPDDQRVFARLGILEADADVSMITTVCDATRDALDRLQDASVIVSRFDSTYGMHKFLRAYAREVLTEDDAEQTATRLLAFWLEEAAYAEFDEHVQTILKHRIVHVMTAARIARDRQDQAAVVSLAKAFSGPLLSVGSAADAETLSLWSADAARALGKLSSEAWGHFFAGQAQEWQGRWKHAEESYRIAASRAHSLRSRRVIQMRLATLLQQLGRPTEALEMGKHAVAEARQAEDKDELAAALNALTALYRQRGDVEAANETVLESSRIRSDHGAPVEKTAHDYHQQGLALIRRDPEEALQFLSTAVSLWENAGDVLHTSIALNSLAEAHRICGKYHDAEKAVMRSLAISPRARGRAYSLTLLSRIQRHLDNVDRAREAIDEACAIYERLGDELGFFSSMVEKSDVARMRGDAESAEKLLQTVVNRSQADLKIKGIAFDKLGGFYLQSGRYEEAVQSYEESLRIFRQLGDEKHIATLENNLARVRQMSSRSTLKGSEQLYLHHVTDVRRTINGFTNTGKFAEAEKYLEKRIEQAARSHQAVLHGVALNELGGLLRKTHQLKRARSTLLKALHIFTHIEPVATGRAASLHKLGDLCHQTRDWVEAEDAYRDSILLKIASGDYVGCAITLDGLASMYNNLQYFEAARTALAEAQKLVSQYGTPMQKRLIQESIAKLDEPPHSDDSA